MPLRYLINSTGAPFDSAELVHLNTEFDSLSDTERTQFRNKNCQTVAEDSASKILIVSGPGTGKSTLFKQRINYWLTKDPSAKILALSFVRKLVADLRNDVQTDRSLTAAQKEQTEVFTLHKYARSIVERNHGNANIKFQPHLRIISEIWEDIVWGDVLLFVAQTDQTTYSLKEYNKQLHNGVFQITPEWSDVKNGYFALSKFYNASGFADLIIYAKDALIENPSLNQHDYLIIDEYQDFNAAEEELINASSKHARGLLIVGDDDQVLYEKLKSGNASLIRNLYRNADFANAMLPFCGRSGFHITKTAGHFVLQNPETDCIEKIYLPISNDTSTPKVQIIGCVAPGTAVDYIKKFVDDNRSEIETRRVELAEGNSKDPFLLILTPSKELKFYSHKDSNQELFKMVAEFQAELKKFSHDYYKLLNYYSLANHPENNFTFRKVLFYEGIIDSDVVEMAKECINSGHNFYQLTSSITSKALEKCKKIKQVIESTDSVEEKVRRIKTEISITDEASLKADMGRRAVNETDIQEIEHQEEEDAELSELEVQPMSAVELMTIVGSKGLSADHVIIIGFDDVNMSRITKNAFYVAMTRARKSLHLVTALGSGGSNKPHSFVDYLPNSHIEFYKYTKSDRRKTSIATLTDFYDYFSSLTYARRRR